MWSGRNHDFWFKSQRILLVISVCQNIHQPFENLMLFSNGHSHVLQSTNKIGDDRIKYTYNQLVIYHSIAIIPYISIKLLIIDITCIFIWFILKYCCCIVTEEEKKNIIKNLCKFHKFWKLWATNYSINI